MNGRNTERENLTPVIPCSTSRMKCNTPGYTYGVSRQAKAENIELNIISNNHVLKEIILRLLRGAAPNVRTVLVSRAL